MVSVPLLSLIACYRFNSHSSLPLSSFSSTNPTLRLQKRSFTKSSNGPLKKSITQIYAIADSCTGDY